MARIGGRRFPLRHPHLALVIGLQVTAPETDREHEIRFVLLDPDGGEVAGATGSLSARSQRDGRDAVLTFSIDLWNLTFPAPGDYSFRILVNGSERKRLPLLLLAPADLPSGRRRAWAPSRRMTEADDRPAGQAAGGPARGAPRATASSTKPRCVAARHADRLLAEARARGLTRWIAYLDPLPDRLRDDEPGALRATALRCRAAYGVKDSVRDVLPAELTEPFLMAVDRLSASSTARRIGAGAETELVRRERLEQERRRDGRVVQQRQAPPRPGPGHVGQAALLLVGPDRVVGLGDGPRAREATGLHPDDDDVVELETLGRVGRRQGQGRVVPAKLGQSSPGVADGWRRTTRGR